MGPKSQAPRIDEARRAELHDIDDLERVVEINRNGRLREAERAETIVIDEAHRFLEWRRGLAVAIGLMIGVLVYGMQVDVFYFPLKAWWLVIGMMFVMSRHAEGICATLVHGVPKPATT